MRFDNPYRYPTHPLLIAFPGLRQIRGCHGPDHYELSKLTKEVYCTKCYKIKNPYSIPLTMLHGLVIGKIILSKCVICNGKVLEYHSATDCDQCFEAFKDFLVNQLMQGRDPNCVTHLIYDVDRKVECRIRMVNRPYYDTNVDDALRNLEPYINIF